MGKYGSFEDKALFGLGLSSGLWKYYKPELAWGALISGIMAYDLLCEDGGTLSETYKRLPTVARVGGVAVMGAHLIGMPEKYDVVSQVFKRIKKP